jgi:hypothetical protein
LNHQTSVRNERMKNRSVICKPWREMGEVTKFPLDSVVIPLSVSFHWKKICISLSIPTSKIPSRSHDKCKGNGGSPSAVRNSRERKRNHLEW